MRSPRLNVLCSQHWTQLSFGGIRDADDQFGTALAAADFNGDGRADLAIGVPNDNVSFAGSVIAHAGEVDVIYGSATGLSITDHPTQRFNQATPGIEDNPEADDRFGASLTAWNFGRNAGIQCGLAGCFTLIVRTADLAIGVQNEGLNGRPNAGAVNVIYGSFAAGLTATDDQFLTQSSLGVGGSEAHDNFGSALY